MGVSSVHKCLYLVSCSHMFPISRTMATLGSGWLQTRSRAVAGQALLPVLGISAAEPGWKDESDESDESDVSRRRKCTCHHLLSFSLPFFTGLPAGGWFQNAMVKSLHSKVLFYI